MHVVYVPLVYQLLLTFDLFVLTRDLLVFLVGGLLALLGFSVRTLQRRLPFNGVVEHSVSRWQHSGKGERTFNNLPARQCSGNCGVAHLQGRRLRWRRSRVSLPGYCHTLNIRCLPLQYDLTACSANYLTAHDKGILYRFRFLQDQVLIYHTPGFGLQFNCRKVFIGIILVQN